MTVTQSDIRLVDGSPLVDVKDLVKYFPVKGGLLQRTVAQVQAVDGVSFAIEPGEVLGMVGESGCGKTTTGRLLLRLIEPTSGSIRFMGKDVLKMDGGELKEARGDMQIVFQDPYASLNPRLPVGDIVGEGLVNHGMSSKKEREAMVAEMLEKVGLRSYYVNRYPHEFSGGQRQRIGLARALVLLPKFIVADEPVSALDVSIQSQILNLMKDLQEEFGLTYLFISHDLSVVRHITDRVAVMYLGKVVEVAETVRLFERPLHPYTYALLSARPEPDPKLKRERLLLTGDVPSPVNPPPACRFHTRCPLARDICREVEPPLELKESGHFAACHFSEEVEGLASRQVTPTLLGQPAVDKPGRRARTAKR